MMDIIEVIGSIILGASIMFFAVGSFLAVILFLVKLVDVLIGVLW